jgi:hypothetical protein
MLMNVFGGGDHFYNKVLVELKKLTEARDLEFISDANEEWQLSSYVQPGRRTFCEVEDARAHRAVLGMLLVPNPTREFSDQAWNRIEEPLREKLLNFERNGQGELSITCTILQVWETDERVVLIPLKDLNRLKRFRATGDFKVKRASGEFVLETPRWDDNIRLHDRLVDIFALL